MDSVRSEESLILYPTPCRSSHWQTKKNQREFINNKNISHVANVLVGKQIYVYICHKSSVCVTSNSESLRGQLDEVAKLDKSGLFGACLYKPPLSWHNFYLRHFKITLPLTFIYMSLFLRRESVVLFSWPNSKILRPCPTTHFICLHSVQPQLSGTDV